MAKTGAAISGARLVAGLAAASLMRAPGAGTCGDSPLTGSVFAGFLSGKISLIRNAGTQEEGAMQGKIALEEHFAIADTVMDSAGFLGEHVWEELKSRRLYIHGTRLAQRA